MIIAFSGHRDKVTEVDWLEDLAASYPDALWVHGGAKGFDTQVDEVAKKMGITTKVILPDYNKYPPKQAPLERNKLIVQDADLVVICWDGRVYGGTLYTMGLAARLRKHTKHCPALPLS